MNSVSILVIFKWTVINTFLSIILNKWIVSSRIVRYFLYQRKLNILMTSRKYEINLQFVKSIITEWTSWLILQVNALLWINNREQRTGHSNYNTQDDLMRRHSIILINLSFSLIFCSYRVRLFVAVVEFLISPWFVFFYLLNSFLFSHVFLDILGYFFYFSLCFCNYPSCPFFFFYLFFYFFFFLPSMSFLFFFFMLSQFFLPFV